MLSLALLSLLLSVGLTLYQASVFVGISLLSLLLVKTYIEQDTKEEDDNLF